MICKQTAPQPPADATPRCAAFGSSCEDTGDPATFCDIEQDGNGACAPGRCALRAAPSVSGDGGEAVVRDVFYTLMPRWNGGMLTAEDMMNGIRAGIARGRELGAREAFEEAAKAAERWGNDDAADSIREIACRAGRGQ